MDYCVLVEKYPNVDEKTVALDRYYGSGSPVVNAICQLAVFNCDTRLIAAIGGDRDGERFAENIMGFGIDRDYLRIREQEATPRAFIWVEKQSGRRTVVLDRDIAPLSPDELPLNELESANFLLIDGVEADAAIAAAQIVRNAGGRTMLDAGAVREHMTEQLALTDYLIVPVAFVREWFGAMDLFQACRELLATGPQLVVVTNGAAGSVAAWEDATQWFPAYPVKSVDTTGAGDLFHAGYLYGLTQEWSVEECIRWASATAALGTTALGGRGHLPTIEEVRALLAESGESNTIS